jgi:hypothetical protein
MRKIKIVLLAIAVLASVSLFAQINAVKVGSKINVTVGGKFFTSYIFHLTRNILFYPVNGPSSGGSVTSMRNGEYPHHSSLFFGCDMLNDGNYWQEGLERGRIISVNAEILKEGGDSVVISDECIWSRPGALSPMKDKRLITITSPSPEIRIIDFAVEMEALQDVVIKKTNHSLFSARIAADLSVKNGGEMMNAEEASGEKDTFGKSSAWMSLSGRRGETVEGLVMMQHPSNRWYPAPWFTRDYGFISPTPMYWPENGVDIRLPKGDNIVLKYRVVVHSGVLSAEAVAHYFENYQKLK